MTTPTLLVVLKTDVASRAVIEATIGATARVVYLSDLQTKQRPEALAQATVLLARHTAKELQEGELAMIGGGTPAPVCNGRRRPHPTRRHAGRSGGRQQRRWLRRTDGRACGCDGACRYEAPIH